MVCTDFLNIYYKVASNLMTDMKFNYYQYELGSAGLTFAEIHASLHEIKLNNCFLENRNEFVLQLKEFLTKDMKLSNILKKHLTRGMNLPDVDQIRLVDNPEFPLKNYEPGYYNPNFIEYALIGSEIGLYKPNILNEEYYFFYETKHPFSQWHKSEFIVDGVKFNSAEQYMMYGKALLFGDTEVADKILKSNNVREQKQLGRQVMNFNKETWDINAIDIVYKGNKNKFTQNLDFQNLLISTKGKTIVEASPTDKVWGIGLLETDPKANSIFDWQGKNWLGIVLTELREEILDNRFLNSYWNTEDYLKNKK